MNMMPPTQNNDMPPSSEESAYAESQPSPPSPQTVEQRVHIYDAASTQREQVLSGFDKQRNAILRAVSDQREAALAPIRTVQARQPPQTALSGMDGRPLGARRVTTTLTTQNDQAQILAEITATIRAMVAIEVCAQLKVMLQSADERIRTQTTPEHDTNK